ncbi:MAG: hypothetical protein ABWY20_16540 [Mycobacterium sp.]
MLCLVDLDQRSRPDVDEVTAQRGRSGRGERGQVPAQCKVDVLQRSNGGAAALIIGQAQVPALIEPVN